MEYASAATALAVLAGIAASDAACCAALGRRSRGQNHRQATELVEQIASGESSGGQRPTPVAQSQGSGPDGLFDVGGQDPQAGLRQAKALVDFADEVVQRRPA